MRALRNLDFYSGIIYQAMGFPVEMFPVLFAIGRMPGWLAQWHEILLDSRGAGLACLPLWLGACGSAALRPGAGASLTLHGRASRPRGSVTSDGRPAVGREKACLC